MRTGELPVNWKRLFIVIVGMAFLGCIFSCGGGGSTHESGSTNRPAANEAAKTSNATENAATNVPASVTGDTAANEAAKTANASENAATNAPANAAESTAGSEANPGTTTKPLDSKPKDFDLVVDSASVLQACYEANEVKADEDCKDKRFAVLGIIDRIGKDILDTPYILFKSRDDTVFGVQCMFDDPNEAEALSSMNPGDKVVIAGVCRGKLGNVIMRGCSDYRSTYKERVKEKARRDAIKKEKEQQAEAESEKQAAEDAQRAEEESRKQAEKDRLSQELHMAKLYLENGRKDLAKNKLRQIIKNYPTKKEAAEAKRLLKEIDKQ